jgi:hypothetical protein
MQEEKSKTLKEIIDSGFDWQSGVCTILVDLCKRVQELEKKLN